MSMYRASVVGLLMGTFLAGPVLAQASNDNVCIQRNRVRSWRAHDDSTIVFRDRQMNDFTVNLRGACRGLTRGNAVLIYPRAGSLSCIAPGDALGVRVAGLAPATCRVASIAAGTPSGTDQSPEHVVDETPGG
jgi:hypothetical protein